LLVLRISADAPGAGLGRSLLHEWPQYAAYALSFLLIGIWWVNHHAFMKLIDRVDRTFLFANIGMAACIAFLPFPTYLIAEHFRDGGLRAATIAFGLTLTGTAACMALLWFHAARTRRLIVETTDPILVRDISRYVGAGPVGTGVATLIAWWSPYVTLALVSASAVFYMFGNSPVKSIEAGSNRGRAS
jgi:uncharacterized membrane protein